MWINTDKKLKKLLGKLVFLNKITIIGTSLCSVDNETGANINQLQFLKTNQRNSANSDSAKPVTRRRSETRNLSYPELESFR